MDQIPSPSPRWNESADADAGVIIERDDSVGWLTLSNPARRNALSVEMLSALPVALGALDDDPGIRVVVVRGAGNTFVSGADITEFAAHRTEADARVSYDRVNDAAWQAWAAFSKPVIAMIDGACYGAGVVVAAFADMRIASSRTRFAVPAARLGIGYPFRGVHLLDAIVGPANTAEILFTARAYTAAEALRIGLVNHVVAPEDLREAAGQLADSIAANAPLTIAACKASLQELHADAPHRNLRRVGDLVERCFSSADYREGQAAFLDKRPPRFQGN